MTPLEGAEAEADVDIQADASGSRRGIQSVGNAVKVLEALASLGQASSLGSVSQVSGLSTSQAHRYLASLIAAGMAQQDDSSGRYDLGPAAIKLGLAALARTDAVRIAETAISEFVRRTGRTVQVCALGPLGPTVIRWYCGMPPVVTSLNVGSVLSLLHSATGHVFLAFSAREEISGLVDSELASDSAVPVDVEALRERICSQGFATVSGIVVPGLRATAFPIFDLQGRPILSATVIASAIFETRNDDRIQEEMARVCSEITERLGGRRPKFEGPTSQSVSRNEFDNGKILSQSKGLSNKRRWRPE
jgi:DNA-binding IclR family transcriptional regulator